MSILTRRRYIGVLIGPVLAATVFGSTIVAAGGPARLWVDDDGMAGPRSCGSFRAAFTSIQEAVDAAGPGDTIRVCPGNYSEEVTIGEGLDGLRIRSTEPGAAVLQPPLSGGSQGIDSVAGAAASSLLSVNGPDGIRIRGFTMRAPTSGYCERIGTMVNVTGGSKDAVIRDARIRAGGSDTIGDCGYDFGIIVSSGAAALLRDNGVKDFQGVGISVLSGNTEATLLRNTVSYHHASESTLGAALGIGIQIISADAVLEGNTVDGLETAATTGPGTPLLGTGIYGSGSTDGLRIRGSLVEDASIGLSLVSVSGAIIEDNDLRHNRDLDCSDDSSGSGTAGTANTWIGNLGNPYKASPEGLCSLP